MENSNYSIIAIVGPTAVGKTAVAIELVSLIGGEIISIDSMAVYKYMNIGTAKPDENELKQAVFHLIDIVEPQQQFSVGDFQRLAQSAISSVSKTNPPAIVVGGSGLYVRAALDGLDEGLPEADIEYRNKIKQMASENGNEHVHDLLKKVDPVSAEKIDSRNLKRVIRALEIHYLTGIAASKHFERDSKRLKNIPEPLIIGLGMNRELLYKRINERVDLMIDMGLVDEVRNLVEKGISTNATSMQAIGYKEIVEYLSGQCGLDCAIELIKKNTRRYAKRQFTWFRADKRIKWIDTDNICPNKIVNKIKEIIADE